MPGDNNEIYSWRYQQRTCMHGLSLSIWIHIQYNIYKTYMRHELLTTLIKFLNMTLYIVIHQKNFFCELSSHKLSHPIENYSIDHQDQAISV